MPTYSFDETNPTDDSYVSAYPANARANRGQMKGIIEREHANSGRHVIPSGDVTARAALADVGAGNWFLDSTEHLLDRYSGSAWVDFGFVRPGMVIATAFSPVSAPRGWLECNGQAVSTTTYARLFAAIGSQFDTQRSMSAPGAGLFRVPDLRGAVVVGFHSGGDGDSEYGALAGFYGTKKFIVEEQNIEQFTVTTGAASDDFSTLVGLAGNGGSPLNVGSTEQNHTHDVTIGQSGADEIDNRQPSMVLGWLIKT